MKAFQNRVINEAFELQDKLIRLEIFLSGDSVEKLSKEDLDLLEKQFVTMRDYLGILRIRIERFE